LTQVIHFLKKIGFVLLLLAAGFQAVAADSSPNPSDIAKWCGDLRSSFRELKWNLEPCDGIEWKFESRSVEGRPLVYAEFGELDSPNTTLIFTAVHGDEITPVYLGIKLARWVQEHVKELAKLPPAQTKHFHVVIAPIVNPDGFFDKPRTRMNAHGVDVNRNFATTDWDTHALQAWKAKYHSDHRRYPGPRSRSEPETVFQEDLIHRFKPKKILSVHSPLNFLDYDGPTAVSLEKFPREYIKKCLELRAQLKAISSGVFPGSLGNFAGRELGIPTLTLELPTADPHKAENYWQHFRRGIHTMIEYEVP